MEFNGPQSVKIKRNPKSGYFGLFAYPKSVTTLSCQLNSKGSHNTGLTPEEEKYYEKQLEGMGVKPGDLGKHSSWWDNVFNTEFAIRLFNTKTTELILDNPINQIKYKVLLAHGDVANSDIERNKPGILFYIDDEEARAKEELKVLNFELEGMKLIIGLTPEQKRGSLRLFGKSNPDLMSEDVCSAQLMMEMKKEPKKFFDIITDKELSTKMFIYELLDKKIISRKGNYFYYNDDLIANTTDECVTYMNDPKNQSVRLGLETKLKKNKKTA
jgi:hypothetical protein